MHYVVCAHCLRVYIAEKAVVHFGELGCPFEGCSGGNVMALDWDCLRKKNKNLPGIPIVGMRYDFSNGKCS